MIETTITINLTVSTTDLKELYEKRLTIYFDGMERLLKLAAALSNPVPEIQAHNNGHRRKEVPSVTSS